MDEVDHQEFDPDGNWKTVSKNKKSKPKIEQKPVPLMKKVVTQSGRSAAGHPRASRPPRLTNRNVAGKKPTPLIDWRAAAKKRVEASEKQKRALLRNVQLKKSAKNPTPLPVRRNANAPARKKSDGGINPTKGKTEDGSNFNSFQEYDDSFPDLPRSEITEEEIAATVEQYQLPEDCSNAPSFYDLNGCDVTADIVKVLNPSLVNEGSLQALAQLSQNQQRLRGEDILNRHTSYIIGDHSAYGVDIENIGLPQGDDRQVQDIPRKKLFNILGDQTQCSVVNIQMSEKDEQKCEEEYKVENFQDEGNLCRNYPEKEMPGKIVCKNKTHRSKTRFQELLAGTDNLEISFEHEKKMKSQDTHPCNTLTHLNNDGQCTADLLNDCLSGSKGDLEIDYTKEEESAEDNVLTTICMKYTEGSTESCIVLSRSDNRNNNCEEASADDEENCLELTALESRCNPDCLGMASYTNEKTVSTISNDTDGGESVKSSNILNAQIDKRRQQAFTPPPKNVGKESISESEKEQKRPDTLQDVHAPVTDQGTGLIQTTSQSGDSDLKPNKETTLEINTNMSPDDAARMCPSWEGIHHNPSLDLRQMMMCDDDTDQSLDFQGETPKIKDVGKEVVAETMNNLPIETKGEKVLHTEKGADTSRYVSKVRRELAFKEPNKRSIISPEFQEEGSKLKCSEEMNLVPRISDCPVDGQDLIGDEKMEQEAEASTFDKKITYGDVIEYVMEQLKEIYSGKEDNAFRPLTRIEHEPLPHELTPQLHDLRELSYNYAPSLHPHNSKENGSLSSFDSETFDSFDEESYRDIAKENDDRIESNDEEDRQLRLKPFHQQLQMFANLNHLHQLVTNPRLERIMEDGELIRVNDYLNKFETCPLRNLTEDTESGLSNTLGANSKNSTTSDNKITFRNRKDSSSVYPHSAKTKQTMEGGVDVHNSNVSDTKQQAGDVEKTAHLFAEDGMIQGADPPKKSRNLLSETEGQLEPLTSIPYSSSVKGPPFLQHSFVSSSARANNSREDTSGCLSAGQEQLLHLRYYLSSQMTDIRASLDREVLGLISGTQWHKKRAENGVWKGGDTAGNNQSGICITRDPPGDITGSVDKDVLAGSLTNDKDFLDKGWLDRTLLDNLSNPPDEEGSEKRSRREYRKKKFGLLPFWWMA